MAGQVLVYAENDSGSNIRLPDPQRSCSIREKKITNLLDEFKFSTMEKVLNNEGLELE